MRLQAKCCVAPRAAMANASTTAKPKRAAKKAVSTAHMRTCNGLSHLNLEFQGRVNTLMSGTDPFASPAGTVFPEQSTGTQVCCPPGEVGYSDGETPRCCIKGERNVVGWPPHYHSMQNALFLCPLGSTFMMRSETLRPAD